jgi:T-complex protein 1 subunit alpha
VLYLSSSSSLATPPPHSSSSFFSHSHSHSLSFLDLSLSHLLLLYIDNITQRANDLVNKKIHPTSVMLGLRLATREACKYITDVLSVKVETLPKDTILNAAKTSMSSKIIGAESEFFSKLVVDALMRVKVVNSKGVTKYPVKAVNILKSHGKSARESVLVEGYALNCTVASQGLFCSFSCPR